MRWADMDERQRAERTEIVQTLSSGGWKETPFSILFLEKGLVLDREAELDYRNSEMALRVSYIASEHAIYISIRRGIFSGIGIGLIIFFEDKLHQMLTALRACQDDISSENYKVYVQSFLDLCPKIFVDKHEQGRVPLQPNREQETM